MNKIGIQSGELYNDDNFSEILPVVKEAGFDCIDFNIDNKISFRETCDGKINEFFLKSDDELKEYYKPQKELLNKLSLTVSQMHAPFPVYAKDNEQATKQLMNATRKCIMLCEFFDCPYLVVHPVKLDDKKEEYNVNIEMYKSLIDDAKKYNVGICLENMFCSKDDHVYEAVCSDIKEAVDYIDTLNEIAGEKIFSFCYDLGHATLLGKNIRASINMLGERLTVLHIHDNNGLKDTHQQPFSNTRGKGWVTDWDGFIGGLKDIGFKGVLSFETFNALVSLPEELHPAMITYIAQVGKYFGSKLS